MIQSLTAIACKVIENAEVRYNKVSHHTSRSLQVAPAEMVLLRLCLLLMFLTVIAVQPFIFYDQVPGAFLYVTATDWANRIMPEFEPSHCRLATLSEKETKFLSGCSC